MDSNMKKVLMVGGGIAAGSLVTYLIVSMMNKDKKDKVTMRGVAPASKRPIYRIPSYARVRGPAPANGPEVNELMWDEIPGEDYNNIRSSWAGRFQ